MNDASSLKRVGVVDLLCTLRRVGYSARWRVPEGRVLDVQSCAVHQELCPSHCGSQGAFNRGFGGAVWVVRVQEEKQNHCGVHACAHVYIRYTFTGI